MDPPSGQLLSRFRSFFESFEVEPSILGITIRFAVKFYTDMVVFDFFDPTQKHVKTLDTVLGSFFKLDKILLENFWKNSKIFSRRREIHFQRWADLQKYDQNRGSAGLLDWSWGSAAKCGGSLKIWKFMKSHDRQRGSKHDCGSSQQ